MKRWHAEPSLMLRRWRIEIAKHENWAWCSLAPLPRDGGRSEAGLCHCYRGPGYFRKRHPFDCGKPRCRVCHYEKFSGRKARANRKRYAILFELAAEGLDTSPDPATLGS